MTATENRSLNAIAGALADANRELAVLRAENAALRTLVLALADKLATVAEHLAMLAERKDARTSTPED